MLSMSKHSNFCTRHISTNKWWKTENLSKRLLTLSTVHTKYLRGPKKIKAECQLYRRITGVPYLQPVKLLISIDFHNSKPRCYQDAYTE